MVNEDSTQLKTMQIQEDTKRIYRKRKSIIILAVAIFFCLIAYVIHSVNEYSKYKNSVDIFFTSLQTGDLKTANSLIDQTEDEKIKFDFQSFDKENLAKAYYSRIEYSVISTHLNNWIFNSNPQKVVVEVKVPDVVSATKTALNEVTYMGLSGGIFTGFQNAIAQSTNVFLKHIQDENQMNSKTIVITVTKIDGKYLLVPDPTLHDILVTQPENIFTVLDTLQGKNRD